MRSHWSLLGLLVAATTARADITPHPLLADHVVLQRGVTIPVWGTAAPGEKIAVKLGTASAQGIADDQGAFRIDLPPAEAATGLTLTLKGANTVTITDVAVGDVWLCSGQSNMEWRVRDLTIDGQGKKVAAAAANPMLRFITIPKKISMTPLKRFSVGNTEGKWFACDEASALNFSAVGYFFGRDIQKSQQVPVGLINSSWGGTPAEAWTSPAALKAQPELAYYMTKLEDLLTHPELAEAKYQADLAQYKKDAEKAKADNKPAPRQPNRPFNQNSATSLYHGMITPLLPFPIRGAIWYQGESNTGKAAEYRTLLPTLITDWRQAWGQELPFFMVQLAPFGAGGLGYAELRDAQWYTTKVLPKVGMAVITDAGDEKDIHPQRKEPAGVRLALAARGIAYSESIEYQGPTLQSVTVKGDSITIRFDHADGLMAKADDNAAPGEDVPVHGFAVAGEDHVFKPAKAKIVGSTVIVTSGDVAGPVAVRYGWANFAKPTLNLFNKAGLPAVPFRTDTLPLTTAPKPAKPADKKSEAKTATLK